MHSRPRTRRALLALGALAMVCSVFGWVGAGSAAVCTPPTIDGNINDLIDYAACVPGCGLDQTTPAGDVCKTNSLIVPCPTLTSCAAGGQYFQNGFDLTRAVLAYDRVSKNLYLGYRVAGVIGDTDGNGNPSTVGGISCNPATNVTDQAGIGTLENYLWTIDTNCDGIPDITVTVSGSQASPTVRVLDGSGDPIPGAGGTGAYSGSDLEARITGLALPPIFLFAGFVGSTPDGLSEDAFPGIKCPDPNFGIDIEKTAAPVNLCPGASTNVTLTIHNTSTVPLTDVTVTDDLPAGLSYVAGSTGGTCAVGEPTPAGQKLTWPVFKLDVDQTCTITFQAQRGALCIGTVTNHAEVVGTFQSPCFNGGVAVGVGPDKDDFDLVCDDAPCVSNVRCELPAEACDGAQIKVTGFATNCGTRNASLTIILSGPGGEIGRQTFANVPANEERKLEVPVTLACTPGETVKYSVSAYAENNCGKSDPSGSTCEVKCLPGPCVNNVRCELPAEACDGAQIKVAGFATNCGERNASLTITLFGPGSVKIGEQTFADVPANEERKLEVSVTLTCTPGTTAKYSVSAYAENSCGKSDPSGSTCEVKCLPGPCVNNVRCELPAQACDGAKITVTGFATNCGERNASLTIILSGPGGEIGRQTFADVPANEERKLEVPVTLTCTPGTTVKYSVSAYAENSCGKSGPSNSTCEIKCLKPEVRLRKVATPPKVDAGGTIHYVITVENPSADVDLERVTLTDELCSNSGNPRNFSGTCPGAGTPTVNGSNISWSPFSLARGTSCTIEFDVTLNTCADCVENAHVIGYCGNTSAEATATATTTCAEGICRLTGGGCLNQAGNQKGRKEHTFGGNVSPLHQGGGPTGNEWQHVVRAVPGKSVLFNFHSHDAHVVHCERVEPGPCSPPAFNTRADFEGTGLYSFGPGGREFTATFKATVIDHNEGACNKGSRDQYGIRVVNTDPRSDFAVGAVVFELPLTDLERTDCGNLQIHETPAKLFQGTGSSGESTPVPTAPNQAMASPGMEPEQIGGLNVLNRPAPNPFSGAMSYSYRVPDGGGQAVDVAVYDLAGRLVRKLASGSQAPGQHTVQWDGRSDAGVQMAPGVYLLRAHVAGVPNVSRMIYLRR